jgi:hypothetical protein
LFTDIEGSPRRWEADARLQDVHGESHETLGVIRIDVNTGIVAASRLQAATGARDCSICIAETEARIPLREAGFA